MADVYIAVSGEKVHRTSSHAGGTINVDLDSNGVPVGVEILGALSVEVDGALVMSWVREPDPVTALESVFELPSERQMEILELLAQGYGQPQIAAKLWLAYNTVRTHTRKLRDYFDAHSNRELVWRARAWGFVGPEGSPAGSGPLLAVAS